MHHYLYQYPSPYPGRRASSLSVGITANAQGGLGRRLYACVIFIGHYHHASLASGDVAIVRDGTTVTPRTSWTQDTT